MPAVLTVSRSQARDGAAIITVKKGSREFSLASRYEPQAEALRLLGVSDDPPDFFFMIGAGYTALASVVCRIYPECCLVIIEQNSRIADLAGEILAESAVAASAMKNGRLLVLTRAGPDNLREIFRQRPSRKITISTNRQEAFLFPEFVKSTYDEIKKAHDRKAINIATISRFEKLWFNNLIRNTRDILHAPGVKELFGKFAGLPAVIVCAGPSLSDQIALLKKNSQCAVIIAVDTIYKTLLRHGIIPDFVVGVDPQKINSRYLENIPEEFKKNTCFIFEPSICNQAIREYPGRIFFFDTIFPYYKFLCRYKGSAGEINMGGSVATTAWDIAMMLGFNPLAFTGLDLSYSRDTYHVPGTMYEEMWFSSITRLRTFEMMIYKLLDYASLQKITDLNGNPAFMDAKFIMFKQWFEEKIRELPAERKIYNCTGGGAGIAGADVLPLADFYKRFSNDQAVKCVRVEVNSCLGKNAFPAEAEKILALDLKKLAGDAAETARRSRAAENLALKINKILVNRQQPDPKLFYRIEKLDASLFCGEDIKELINILIQRIVFHIQEEYDMEFDEPVPAERRAIMTSVYLYREITLSAELVRKKLLELF